MLTNLLLLLAIITATTNTVGSATKRPEAPQTPLIENSISASFVSPEGAKVSVSLEVANNDISRTTGLMFRTELPKYHGMLFIWPKEESQVHAFWMRNTYIPLDMIFALNDDIVGFSQNAEPLTDSPRTSGKVGNIVIELNGGFIKKHQINDSWTLNLPEEYR